MKKVVAVVLVAGMLLVSLLVLGIAAAGGAYLWASQPVIGPVEPGLEALIGSPAPDEAHEDVPAAVLPEPEAAVAAPSPSSSGSASPSPAPRGAPSPAPKRAAPAPTPTPTPEPAPEPEPDPTEDLPEDEAESLDEVLDDWVIEDLDTPEPKKRGRKR